MADLAKEYFGPVTAWVAKSEAGMRFLSSMGEEIDDERILVQSNRNALIGRQAKDAGLTIDE